MLYNRKIANIFGISAIIISLSSFYSYGGNNTALKPGLEFIENKSQWQKVILYKSALPDGVLFLEKSCLTFNFINGNDIKHSNAHHHAEREHTPKIIHFHSYKLHFINANKNPDISGSDASRDYVNFYKGNDQSRWSSGVKKFRTVTYKNIYRKIDLKVYSNGSNLKYDFIVYPGGDPSDIELLYEGITGISLKKGNLQISTSINTITELKPLAFQHPASDETSTANNKISEKTDCRFVLNNRTVKFDVGIYDKSRALVIDPQLIFSTYSGSLADNWGFTATFDKENNVYSGGIVFGIGYPVTTGAYQVEFGGDTDYDFGEDIGIIKYDSTGKTALYATYLGGKGAELPHSLIINEQNELLIFGTTGSANFPTSTNAYNRVFKGGQNVYYDNVIAFNNGIDIFVSKLSPDGTQLLGSTLIGGTDNDGFNFRSRYVNNIMHGNDSLYYNYADGARGEVITDRQNNVYVGTCTFSNDFPVTDTAFQKVSSGRQEGVVFKFDSNLSQLMWSSYLGGSLDDAIYSVDVDNNYNLYVAGGTNSVNFPTTEKAYKRNYTGGSADGFLAHISMDGKRLLGCTYFGSSDYDQAYFVRADRANFPHITGQTRAPGSTLIFNSQYNKPNSGQFITKFTPMLDTIKWSTVFGTGNGKPNISITAFAVDICDKIYLSGWGREWANTPQYPSWGNIEGTKNMEITQDAVQKTTDGQDFYIMVLDNNASKLYYGTYFGELNYTGCSYSGHDHVDGGTSRFDKRGNIYESVCASCGSCQRFPTTEGAWSESNKSDNCNNAVFKINVFKGVALADFSWEIKGCAPYKVSFTNKSEGQKFIWDFGDNTFSNDKNPTHIFSQSGSYTVKLKVLDSASCNIADSVFKQIAVPDAFTAKVLDTNHVQCNGECNAVLYAIASGGIKPYTYIWSDGETDSIAKNLCGGLYLLTVSDQAGCIKKFSVNISDASDFKVALDTVINMCYGKCEGIAKVIASGGSEPYNYLWDNGQKDTLVKNLCSGIHSVTVTESLGCRRVIYFEIKEYSEITAEMEYLSNLVCFGDCNAKIKALISGGTPPYKFIWNTGEESDTLGNLCAGKYNLTVVDKNNCLLDTGITVISPQPLSVFIVKTNVPCISSCTGTATVDASGGTSPYRFAWSNGDTTKAVASLCKGDYSVTVTDKNLCRTVKNVKIIDSSFFPAITIKADPNPISAGGTSQITVTPVDTSWKYSWAPDNGLSSATSPTPSATPNKTTTYHLTITDKYGCTQIDSVRITLLDTRCDEPYIFIPNAFTPDATSNNILYVRSIVIEQLYFAIYNRWGEKVFETNDQKKGWDGTYRGEKCSPAVFDYYLEATCLNKQTYKHKGNITLIR